MEIQVEQCRYRSYDLPEDALRLLPDLFAEISRLDSMDALDYMSGGQICWIDDLLYKHAEDKFVYVSRKTFLYLAKLASGEMTTPFEPHLKPSLAGWTLLQENELNRSLEQALTQSQGKGRAAMLASLHRVFVGYGLPTEALPHRINRKVVPSVDLVISLFLDDLLWNAPITKTIRRLPSEQ